MCGRKVCLLPPANSFVVQHINKPPRNARAEYGFGMKFSEANPKSSLQNTIDAKRNIPVSATCLHRLVEDVLS